MNLYALLIGLGASLAVWRVTKTVVPNLALRWALAALHALGGALIGARLAFLLWQPASFAAQPLSLFRFDQGGFVWFGAVPGGLIVTWIIAKQRSLPFAMVADRLVTMLPPLGIMTWLACWTAGCAYGRVITNADWLPMSVDETGLWAVRFPLQWVAALSLFLIFALYESRFPKKRPGQRAALTWLLFSTHTLLLSFFRADPRPSWQGLTYDEWAAMIYLVSALVFFIMTFWPRKKIERYA